MRWTKNNIYRRIQSQDNTFLAGSGNGEDVEKIGKKLWETTYYLSIFKTWIMPRYLELITCFNTKGMDLALLASCNHTISSYGTFSFWSGFLAGGKRIIPSMILNRWKRPLNINLDPFVMPDEGLSYEADWEKQKRLNVDTLIYF